VAESILSTSELDALRQAVDTNDVPKGRRTSTSILEFGDDLPRLRFGEIRIGGSQREERLAYAFDRAARSLEVGLADIIQVATQVGVTYLKTSRYAEFREMFEVDARELALLGFRVAGLAEEGLVCVEPAVVERMVEGLMGGGANGDELAAAVGLSARRPLTALDLRVTRRWLGKFLRDLGAAWNPVRPLDLSLTAADTSGVAARTFTSDTQVVIALLEISCADEVVGMLGMVMPHAAIDSLAVPGARRRRTVTESGPVTAGPFAPDVPGFSVNVGVVLGRRSMTVRDLLALEVGDTLSFDRLNTAIGSVQGIPKFTGHPGIQAGRKAFRITNLTHGDLKDA
jgi:flagellar motor switch protein FliM